MMFPEVFTNPGFVYSGEHELKAAVADGLSGWTCCQAGTEPPEEFGKGMVKIGQIIGQAATPDNLDKLADKILDN